MGVKPGLNTAKTTDQRETTCKACRFGIFAHQPRVWCRQPLGLVHPWCVPDGVAR